MIKKLIAGGLALFIAVLSVPMLSAFESHVINVTAQITNALLVMPQTRQFGTVFPQEFRRLNFIVTFSQSLLLDGVSSKVDYTIRQKPKPRPEYEDEIGESDAREWCHDNYPVELYPGQTPEGQAEWTEYLENCFPTLCPYLSKTPSNLDGNDVGVPAFHNPETATSIGTIIEDDDGFDVWTIDLPVPCFQEQCSQDWDEFVHQHNPQANPRDFILPKELEGEVFGCDLWVEVTRIY